MKKTSSDLKHTKSSSDYENVSNHNLYRFIMKLIVKIKCTFIDLVLLFNSERQLLIIFIYAIFNY